MRLEVTFFGKLKRELFHLKYQPVNADFFFHFQLDFRTSSAIDNFHGNIFTGVFVGEELYSI